MKRRKRAKWSKDSAWIFEVQRDFLLAEIDKAIEKAPVILPYLYERFPENITDKVKIQLPDPEEGHGTEYIISNSTGCLEKFKKMVRRYFRLPSRI